MSVLKFGVLDSTNRKLKELAQDDVSLPHGSVVVADSQILGRGRLGRNFHSPVGGLYMSYLYTECSVEDLMLLTPWTAVAVVRAIGRLTGISPAIKWVNDIIVNQRKIGGILVESVFESGALKCAVIGIGINLLGKRADFPEDLQSKVGTIESEGGVLCCRDDLLCEICKELNSLRGIGAEGRERLFCEYRSRLLTLGRDALVISPLGERVARICELREDYSLAVRYSDGNEGVISAGEVSVRLENGEYI